MKCKFHLPYKYLLLWFWSPCVISGWLWLCGTVSKGCLKKRRTWIDRQDDQIHFMLRKWRSRICTELQDKYNVIYQQQQETRLYSIGSMSVINKLTGNKRKLITVFFASRHLNQCAMRRVEEARHKLWFGFLQIVVVVGMVIVWRTQRSDGSLTAAEKIINTHFL